MKIFKLLLILLGSLGLFTYAQAEETTKIYRFKKPHICNTKVCLYDNFMTDKEEIYDTSGMVLYLLTDMKNKSYLVELQENKKQLPLSLAVANFDKAYPSGEKSLVLLYRVDCGSYKYKVETLLAYSDLFGKGKFLGERNMDNDWMFPDTSIMNFAIKQLCK